MTDVIIVFAPWAIFTAALAIVLFQMRWPRRPRGRPPHRHGDPLQMHQPRPGASEGEPPVSSQEAGGPSKRGARP
jgi:hypothetical protein